jgi:prepilin-type N-terminal cleavage/methylation domain-containing protein
MMMGEGRRRGFTFIEIMLVMLIVGLLSSIAVPKYLDLKRRASTTNVIADFQVVRVAVLNFYGDSSYFPPEAPAGVIPPSLQRYLPQGFDFTGHGWTLDYENWELAPVAGPNGEPVLVGLTVTSDDPILAETTSRVLGNVPQIVYGDAYTFVISGM